LAQLIASHSNGTRATLGARGAQDLLPSILSGQNWNSTRGVLFLNPYGLQCTWKMVEDVAATDDRSVAETVSSQADNGRQQPLHSWYSLGRVERQLLAGTASSTATRIAAFGHSGDPTEGPLSGPAANSQLRPQPDGRERPQSAKPVPALFAQAPAS